MLEYTANAAVKAGFARAHEARGAVLKQAWRWLVARRIPLGGHRTAVSRWA
ncbi:hypothetical protein [Cribrihabitans neustonicus]|uniref:hypothetical protein n=1 Tax=Cribrihabitans neustonicus TaxID=1429085 RepID=UPI003B5B1578